MLAKSRRCSKRVLLNRERNSKIWDMEKKMICPKCGKENRIKNGYHRGKQIYLCKNCGCNYTGSKRGYPEEVKRKVIKCYLEGLGFRQIERLMHVSHVSVINWAKKAAKEIRKEKDKGEKNNIKTEVIELDEMCVNFKKTSGYGQR